MNSGGKSRKINGKDRAPRVKSDSVCFCSSIYKTESRLTKSSTQRCYMNWLINDRNPLLKIPKNAVNAKDVLQRNHLISKTKAAPT